MSLHEVWLSDAAEDIEMPTAIFRIHTLEGFVIASDSRDTNETDGTYRDGVQKIFPLPDGKLAYSLAGTSKVRTSDGRPLFDILDALNGAIPNLTLANEWSPFLHQMAVLLRDSLAIVSVLPPSLDDTFIFIDGFVAGQPKSGYLRIIYSSLPIQIEVNGDEDLTALRQVGSPRVLDALKTGNDQRFQWLLRPRKSDCKNLRAAIEHGRHQIQAHSLPVALELDYKTCAAVGGPLYIATITTARGFQWIERPHQF